MEEGITQVLSGRETLKISRRVTDVFMNQPASERLEAILSLMRLHHLQLVNPSPSLRVSTSQPVADAHEVAAPAGSAPQETGAAGVAAPAGAGNSG